MRMSSSLAVCTAAVLGVSALLAQSTSPSVATTSSTPSPVARVYVTSQTSATAAPEIRAYNADSEGRLTPIAGGPWPGLASATTGTYFFALDQTFRNAISYKVASNGSLTKVANYDLANRAPSGCANYETFSPPTLDHTGATLYATGGEFSSGAGDGTCADNAVTQSYRINKDTGDLTYLGSVDSFYEVTFDGNNKYTFSGGCYCKSSDQDTDIIGLQRDSDGMLALATTTSDQPIDAPSGTSWAAPATAADPTDHLAVALEPAQSPWHSLLAAYTIGSNGSLTTTNTYDQMPNIGDLIGPMQMSPSGLLLAVADNTEGLHVMHFNGADPITPYALLLPNTQVFSLAWDNANHLYAATTGGKLYVFTVTPTGWLQAPGSPYLISYAGDLVVRSLTSQ